VPDVGGVRRASGKDPVYTENAPCPSAPSSFDRLQRTHRPLQDHTRCTVVAPDERLSPSLRGFVDEQPILAIVLFSSSFRPVQIKFFKDIIRFLFSQERSNFYSFLIGNILVILFSNCFLVLFYFSLRR